LKEEYFMVYGGAAASSGAAAAAAAALAQAVKASGAIVKMKPDDFNKILAKLDDPLVVQAQSGWRKKKYQYLTSYKGLIFFTTTPDRLNLPSGTELIAAEKIWIPS
jgi:hypothetical protein